MNVLFELQRVSAYFSPVKIDIKIVIKEQKFQQS